MCLSRGVATSGRVLLDDDIHPCLAKKEEEKTTGNSLSGNFSHFGTREHQQRFSAGKSPRTFG